MKFLVLFIFLIYPVIQNALAIKSNSKEAPEVFGVLVQVENKEVLTHQDFLKIKSEFNLTEKNYFSALKVVSLIPQSNKPKIEKEKMVEFCKRITTLKQVIHCELNQKLSMNDFAEPCPNSNKIKISLPITAITDQLKCKLVSDKPSPHNKKGLSPFWAQEYTGADLLRERLMSIPHLKSLDNLFEVWDIGIHGEYVTNLIEGPHPSAVIPQSLAKKYKDLFNPEYGVNNYQEFYEQCNQKNQCPHYINNSMSWGDSELIGQVVKNISDKGSVFISAAGNESTQLEKLKQKLSRENSVITVGSLTPKGSGSDFTCVGSDLTISAPSDLSITSYDLKGKVASFSGTSGAAPQVTAALAAFTLISGYKLNTKQAKELLLKTAIMLPYYPEPNGLGAGMLNTYKIGEIAFKLQNECNGSEDCVTNKLKNDSLYSFKYLEANFDREIKNIFPGCFQNKGPLSSESSCIEKIDLFNKIRKAALLNPENKKLWETIACISGEDGLSQNQKFYQSLAERIGKTDKQLLSKLTEAELVKVMLSHTHISTDEAIERAIAKKGADNEIIRYIFTNPKLKNNPKINKWITKILERSNEVNVIDMIELVLSDSEIMSNPNWTNWIDRILQKNSADNIIVSKILNKPEIMNHPKFNKWIEIIIKRSKSEKSTKRDLIALVLSKDHLTKHPNFNRWIDKYINEHINLQEVALHILSKPGIQNNSNFNRWMESYLKLPNKQALLQPVMAEEHIKMLPQYSKWMEMIRLP